MPELPEVQSIVASLEPALTGARIRRVQLARRDVISGDARPAALLEGGVIVALRRRGKQMALLANDGRALVLQLGMSGQLFAMSRERTPPKADHIHIRWELVDKAGREWTLYFRDPRRFGGVTSLENVAALDKRWSDLGPDALTIRAAELAPRLAATTRAIKPALLDQGLIAGVGNIYADEALYLAGIWPRRRSDRLTPAEARRLAGAIRRVLRAAVAAGGTTLRDYVDGAGEPGGYLLKHAVYGRAGQACRGCGGRLRGFVLGQRATVACPACQPAKGR